MYQKVDYKTTTGLHIRVTEFNLFPRLNMTGKKF